MIGWIYLAFSFFILFAQNLQWLVTIIPEGIVSIISKLISQSHPFSFYKKQINKTKGKTLG